MVAGCTAPSGSWVRGHGFDHYVIESGVGEPQQPLHVYLAGDGRPFLRRDQIAADPTVQRPLIWSLQKRDPQPSIYIGRPCYHGRNQACSPQWWTSHRYAPEIVHSMVAATRRAAGDRPLVLIGHSGGGALAVRMAARMPQVVGVVTLAANLDVQAWTDWHRYTPLEPRTVAFDLARVRPEVWQRHLVGGQDKVVPPRTVASVARRLPPESVCLVPRYDHNCCWRRDWPALIERLHLSNCGDLADGRIVVEPFEKGVQSE